MLSKEGQNEKWKSDKVKSDKVRDIDKKILQQLIQNPEGLRVKSLSKYCDLSSLKLYRRLNFLRKKGLIENIFPIWRIVHGGYEKVIKCLGSENIFELHNLSYVLKLVKTPDWWPKRKPRLERIKEWHFKNIDFGNGGTNHYQQLTNENFVIQTYPQSIIIISRKRYYSNSPYEVITQAINDVLDIIEYFEERMKFKFFPNEIPALEIRNNDFNRMKDYLAEHCKTEGRRFLVEIDKNRKVWVDYSEPFGKETNYPEGQEILEKVTKDFLINKPLLNSELQLLVQRVTENQMIFAENMQSHIKAVQELGAGVKKLTETVERLSK